MARRRKFVGSIAVWGICLFMAGKTWAAPEILASPPLGLEPTSILIFGDSMADGIWGGLTRTLLRDPSIKLLRRAKNGTGLARPDVYDWPTNLQTLLETEKTDIAIIALGLNDRQDLFANGRRQHFFRSEAWKTAYLERIQSLLDPLIEKRIPTLWVGLPILRDVAASRDSEFLNRLYEPAAAAAGVSFFPLWTLSVDETHAYKTHVKGSDGRLRSFRNEDGMHFTPMGYDLVAQALLQRLGPWLKKPPTP